ncbi:MAG: DUF2333 family protein [Deltaproteobacteria bacterium]|nr:DUF2333 family protein [Deltaproteobacteria bacterium]
MNPTPEKSEPRPSRLAWLNPFGGGISPVKRLVRAVLLVVVLYFLVAPFVWWREYSRAFPDFFDPRPPAKEAADVQAYPPGTVYTGAMITLGEQLLTGWLPNDILYPSIFLDNPQNFQLGVLEVLRYASRVLRDNLSRQRTTDKIDAEADRAFTDFSNNPKLWMLPSAESKISDGVLTLKRFQANLKTKKSNFYPRADNLIEMMEQFTSLLGGVDTRLANAPRDWSLHLSEETAGDRYSEGETMTSVKVPWTQVDDNFYFARGVSYGLREMLLAAQWEFADVIKMKRSDELWQNVVDELALANFEPLFVLNGSRDSVFANHSLMLMATLEDCRQKMSNIQHMLER